MQPQCTGRGEVWVGISSLERRVFGHLSLPIRFLVMESLEGETLADRLARGPMPLDQALRHAVEIGGPFDKAHRQGIVHRDLKPGNVMLTKSGAAKLLAMR